jgi:hypothetical protein
MASWASVTHAAEMYLNKLCQTWVEQSMTLHADGGPPCCWSSKDARVRYLEALCHAIGNSLCSFC